ncbi:HdeD family acid-resistance protein, partial [Legionella pneumophila]
LYIAAGCIVLYDPFLASTLITAFLAAMLIIIGLTRMIMAFALKDSKGWGWLLLAGITAIILGILILMQWPISGLWIIGLFIAIELIVTGWTYIFIAISVKTAKL